MKHLTIRAVRQRRGWTQEQLETQSGVSQAAISAIERGLRPDPAFSTIAKLAKALGVDPREFRFPQQVA